MDNLLDKTGVKRLLNNIKDWVSNNIQNIKDWVSDKFIDVDDREYYPWEIQYLVKTNQLKPGKQYKIYYNYESNISYKNNIHFMFPFNVCFIVLRAVNENTFSNNATYFDYLNKAYSCIFDYGNNKYSNYTTGLYASKINYNNEDYWLNNIYNFNSSDKIIMFVCGNNKIYVKFDQIKKAITGNTINIFLDEACTIGAQGIYYYNGLGTITYLKDNKGNEAPFDFINLKINNKAIITGSNNIIKSFNPSTPIFIEGDNNFVDYDCAGINIIGNRNIVEKNCVEIEINGDDNYIEYRIQYAYITNSFSCRIGHHSQEVCINNTFDCNVGNYCAGVETDKSCVGNNCYLIFYPQNHCDDNKCFNEFTDSPIRNFLIPKAPHLDIDDVIGDIQNENIIIERYQDEHGNLIVTILLKTGLITEDYPGESFYIEDSSGFNTIQTSFDGNNIYGNSVGISVVKNNDELCIKYDFIFNFNDYSLSSEDLNTIYLLIEREDDFYTTISNDNYEKGITIK